jgi:hypothetical protein
VDRALVGLVATNALGKLVRRGQDSMVFNTYPTSKLTPKMPTADLISVWGRLHQAMYRKLSSQLAPSFRQGRRER